MEKKLQVVCFGEVLWDVMLTNRLVGGAPLNVCYHLTQLGISAGVISQAGDDDDGTLLLDAIRRLGVNTDFISLTAAHPTSLVLVELSAGNNATYRIVENVAWDYIPYDIQIAQSVATAGCFVYGSLAARSDASRATLYSYIAHANRKVLDLNLRFPYYTRGIVHDLLLTCDTLKINEDELQTIGDAFIAPGIGAEAILNGIVNQFPNINEVIVTMGARGARYFSKEMDMEFPALSVDVVDTVGSGDAFLAAFLAGRLQQKPVPQCMREAIILSGYVAGKRGACPEYSKGDVYGASA